MFFCFDIIIIKFNASVGRVVSCVLLLRLVGFTLCSASIYGIELVLKRCPTQMEDFAKTCRVKRHSFAVFSFNLMISKVIKYIIYKTIIGDNGCFKV